MARRRGGRGKRVFDSLFHRLKEVTEVGDDIRLDLDDAWTLWRSLQDIIRSHCV